MQIKYISLWFEHFFILPARWFRVHYRAWWDLQQKCKVCGCRDKFDFYVPDYIWQRVVPSLYQNRVVCLACFDDFAQKKGVDYSTSLERLYFAGDRASFQFQLCSRPK